MSMKDSKWVEYIDSKGNPYYYNPETGDSKRKKPDDFVEDCKPENRPKKVRNDNHKWIKQIDDKGLIVYYNKITGQTTSKKPKKYSNSAEQAKKSSSSTEINRHAEKSSSKERDRSKSSTPSFSPSETTKASYSSRVSEKSKMRQFKDLMSEHIFSSEITWERAVESMKNDRRFSLLPTREMRKLFNLFKDKKDQDEKLSKTEYEDKVRKSFEEFLLKDTRVSAILSYNEADELFENEEVWASVDDSTRQKLFTKMKPIIFNKEIKRLKHTRDSNIKKLNEIFRKMTNITYQTTWAEAQQYLLDDAVFLEDAELQNMDKEDALNIFQNLIKEMETEHNHEREFIAKATEILHAEYRANFQSLLRKLKRDRRLNEDSLWKDIFPYIRNHPDFLNMLGIPGSTPLDIFKIYVHDLKYNYSYDISVITSLIKNFHYEITLKTSLNSFINMVRSTREGSKVRTSNLNYYYYSSINRLKSTKKASEPMTPYERKRTDFKRLLYKLGPDVLTKDCIYASLLSKIIDSPEYKNFTDESEKYKIFKKMRRHFHGDNKQDSDIHNSSPSESSESDFDEMSAQTNY